MAGAAFKEAMGSTSSPEVLLFKRFHDKWEWIDKQKFEDGMSDDAVRELVLPLKMKSLNSLVMHLQSCNLEMTYQEMLKLASVF